MKTVRICSDRPRPGHKFLEADCGNCKGLCCILLPFDADQGFGFDKAAAVPCSNLMQDFKCCIHPALVQRGFPACRQYNCHGAGQYVSAVLELGEDWYESPAVVSAAYELFVTIKTAHLRLKARIQKG
jgi:hypothetical protein